MASVIGTPEQRVVIRNVSWATYERLLADRGDGSAPRFSFDRGVLEIMSPSPEHERCKEALVEIVRAVAEARETNAECLGSTTFGREDLDSGFEPDSCFYVQNASQIAGKNRLDLSIDPPPDLVIEVDITRDSIKKLPIYAALRVPEIWRYDGARLTILTYGDGTYAERRESACLPGITTAEVSRLVQERQASDWTVWIRRVRKWAEGKAD